MKKKLLPLIVLASVGLVLCLIAFIVSQNHARVLTDAVLHGLLACYDAATPEGEGAISPDRIRGVIRADLDAPVEKPHLLPSFVNANDVLYPNRAVPKGSDEIACAIRVGEAKYCAVNGNRVCVVLDQKGIDAWLRGQ